ncbi:MAG: hypothetical protein JZU53_03750 [Paludibacter sp.]|nr:hypothetical protein [Paludibacter sp.]
MNKTKLFLNVIINKTKLFLNVIINKTKLYLKVFVLLIIIISLVFVLKPAHRFHNLMHMDNFIECNSSVNIRHVLDFIDDKGNLRKNPRLSIVITPASDSIDFVEDFSINFSCNYKYDAYQVLMNGKQQRINVNCVSSLDVPVHHTQEVTKNLIKRIESNNIPRADLYQTKLQINKSTKNVTLNLYFQNPAECMGFFMKGIYLEHNTKLNNKVIDESNNNIIDIRLPNNLENLIVRTKTSTLSPIFESFFNRYITEDKLENNKSFRQNFYITYSESYSILTKDLILIVLSTLFGMILSSLFEIRRKTNT